MSRNRSLSHFLFIKIAILSITPIAVIAIFTYGTLIPQLQQRVNTENQALARAIKVQVELFLKTPQLVLNGISAEIESLPNLSLADLRQILDGQIEKNSLFDTIYLVNSDSRIDIMGMPLARRPFREDYEGMDLGKRTFINEARLRQSPYWSNTFLSLISGTNSLALAQPINGKVLVGEFSIEQLSRFIQQIKANDNLLIMITDQLGQIIAHPDSGKAITQRNISNLAVVKQALSNQAQTETFELNGIQHIGSSLPIPAMGWTILAAQPVKHAQQDVLAVQMILLASFIVAALLALITGKMIALRIAAPFEQFTRSAIEVSKGHYKKQLPTSEIVEVKQLAQSFTSMIDAIQQREASLEQSQQKYRELVEGTDDLVTRVDGQGKLTYVNHSAKRIFGLNPQDCIGRSAFDFIHPEDRAATTEAFIRWSWQKLDSATFENRQLSLNGESHHLLWSINLHRDPAGEVVEISSIGHDITPRILNEQENRRLQKYLSNIINSMPSAIIGISRDGIITQWNKQAASLFVIESEDIIGQPLSSVESNALPEMSLIEQSIHTGRTHTTRKALKQSVIDISIFPLIDLKVEGAVIRIDDVSEKVQLEEIMIQSEKMLSVGGLAAGMAHEINNPLAGILQNTQVIQNRFSPTHEKNRRTAAACGIELEALNAYLDQRGIRQMFESVIESGRRAARIVENMLNFSRKSTSSMIPQDLAVLIDKTLDLATNDYDLKKRFDFRQIEIVKEYDPQMPEVVCEPGKIQQVLLNLLKNGAQAMAESPQTKPRLTLRLIQEKKMARIDIEDNGPGMSESTRKRIFEPFFTTKNIGEGTGLGLSVSYFIITENHKGQMNVESTPGNGACFTLRLPINNH